MGDEASGEVAAAADIHCSYFFLSLEFSLVEDIQSTELRAALRPWGSLSFIPKTVVERPGWVLGPGELSSVFGHNQV